MNLNNIQEGDRRAIEVVAEGLPLYAGAQLAIDTTLTSPLSANGQPRFGSDEIDGAALKNIRQTKMTTYREVVSTRRCHLLVAAMETGGRCDKQLVHFLRHLAKFKAESAPKLLRRSAEFGWYRRWSGLLAVATHSAYAASLLEEIMDTPSCEGGVIPTVGSLLAEDRFC